MTEPRRIPPPDDRAERDQLREEVIDFKVALRATARDHKKLLEKIWDEPEVQAVRESVTAQGHVQHPMHDALWPLIERLRAQIAELGTQLATMDSYRADTEQKLGAGELSDGHHTHNELYEQRMFYNAALFNTWNEYNHCADPYGAWPDFPEVVKSWNHSDGEPCFGGGWFIVVAKLPTGQISQHYQAKHWDLFKVPKVDLPPEYDGHTSQEAMYRLKDYLRTV